jgi:hypothetical protein
MPSEASCYYGSCRSYVGSHDDISYAEIRILHPILEPGNYVVLRDYGWRMFSRLQ